LGNEEIQKVSAKENKSGDFLGKDIEAEAEIVCTLAQRNARSVCLMEAV
jgi:hypothetical protein